MTRKLSRPKKQEVPPTQHTPGAQDTPQFEDPEGATEYDVDREVMCTVMPDGVPVVWDLCGACSRSITVCECVQVTMPRWVTHIRTRTYEWIRSDHPAGDLTHDPGLRVDEGGESAEPGTGVLEHAEQDQSDDPADDPTSTPAPALRGARRSKRRRPVHDADTGGRT